jgi:uncharacterized protein YrrD
MEFKQNAPVRTALGENAGHVDRVVLNPKTKEVTHIVVRKGLLFAEEKVVPIGMIASATEVEVTLREDAGDLHSLPKYSEKCLVVAEEDGYGRPHAAPTGYSPYGTPGVELSTTQPAVISKTLVNIPDAEVALKEGAWVVSSDRKMLGNVEEVLTDANRATYIIVVHGLLSKSRKFVPATWIADVSEDEVRLAVGSDIVEKLNEYNTVVYPPN